MKTYRLKLPWPPTINHYWKHSRWGHYITEKGKDYRQNIITLIKQQDLDILTPSRIRITITAHPPDRRRRDIDNLPKAVFDSLTHAHFWVDDEQIDDMRITRGELIKGGCLDVQIWELD
ncbi:RusA family crossover junction endodeoxyribonuclease [Xenorhabdus innexi]|uniref:Crossover junction endodeoxyribonuclease rusA n=1 Tax=Xenorhabdus innexi TaxID=290109 RepID=A0A1N6N1Z7_9GAMM|nr:RusA family crossover junction endodeoxyribonuclease [Xenorhabdus innexi]PHM37164.1 endodeoxyribonuclease [Xenorhabdus innexi]SIP75054.1 Crossover junction endodeoxyribonuclease rusA [Xenorhabdus innexi]